METSYACKGSDNLLILQGAWSYYSVLYPTYGDTPEPLFAPNTPIPLFSLSPQIALP